MIRRSTAPGRRRPPIALPALWAALWATLWLVAVVLPPMAVGMAEHACCRDGCADGCCDLRFKPYEPSTDGPGFTKAPTCPEDCLGAEALTAPPVRLASAAVVVGSPTSGRHGGAPVAAPAPTAAPWSPASPRAPPFS